MASVARLQSLPDCKALIGSNVLDPIQSHMPFDVMNHVAALVRGKTLVEVGSRRGDVIDCLSYFSAHAISLEGDPEYCTTLATRAASCDGRWVSRCDAFSGTLTPMPSAQLYWTWIQEWLVLPFLAALRQQQLHGAVRSDAAFVFTFGDRAGWPQEHRCWQALRPFATSHSDVGYDRVDSNSTDGPTVYRRRGNFVVAMFHPYTLNMSRLVRATRGRCGKLETPTDLWVKANAARRREITAAAEDAT